MYTFVLGPLRLTSLMVGHLQITSGVKFLIALNLTVFNWPFRKQHIKRETICHSLCLRLSLTSIMDGHLQTTKSV